MKINLLKHIAMSGVIIFLLSCSDDLDTNPVNKTSATTALETTENAALAINGIAKLMSIQYLHSQGFNGEGTIKMYYGNYLGNHFAVNLSGWSNVINGNHYQDSDSKYDYYPWFYYYKLISNANEIIAEIDDAEGSQKERDYIKAQALTYRAYSYFMLSQIYGDRWQDSNNGSTPAVVLRTEPNSDELPLSSLAEIYDQVYADLDQALSLFDSAEYSRSENYEIDKTVTQAVYARAALTKQDYSKAEKYAAKAREGYPLMDVENYKDGFANPTSEWIWSVYGASDETLYYYSYFAYIGYNSNASNVRSYPKRMSKELYEQIPDSDIRKDMFLAPHGMDYNTNTGEAGDQLDAYAREQFPDLKDNSAIYTYMQFKVKNNANPGVGNLNNFRTSEMVLIEAEAKYFNNENESEVQHLLEELTAASGRDPNYTCTETGEDLLDEIKKYRAIELWGEGFDWFDYKRWGDPINRKSATDGGNFLSVLAVQYGPDEKNKWKWVIPEKETNHNEEIE